MRTRDRFETAIVLAATSASLVYLIRIFLEFRVGRFESFFVVRWGHARSSLVAISIYIVSNGYVIINYSQGMLITWTWAIGLLAFRGPSGRSRRLQRRPGVMVCAAATVALALHWLRVPLAWPLAILQDNAWEGRLSIYGVFKIDDVFGTPVGIAVGAAWMALALNGRWTRPRDLPDRIGRIVGGIWIGLALFWLGFGIRFS